MKYTFTHEEAWKIVDALVKTTRSTRRYNLLLSFIQSIKYMDDMKVVTIELHPADAAYLGYSRLIKI